MNNINDMNNIKPWFRDDIARTLMSVYFASCANQDQSAAGGSNEYRKGFAAALASVSLAVGVNPETFLAPEDVQRLRKETR